MYPCPDATAPHPPPAPRSVVRRGAVLLIVLAFIALMGLIVSAFLKDAADRIRLSAQFMQRDDLRLEAYGAFDIALAVLAELREIDKELYAPVQGWGDPLTYAGVVPAEGIVLEVKVVDEGGKFGLAKLDETTLRALFEELGFDFMVAEQLSDCLLDWIDADDETRLNGAEKDYYEDLPEPYRPGNAVIKSWDEFALIQYFNEVFFDPEGRPNERFHAFREAVSLHHAESVNLNTAVPLVLQTIARLENFDPESVRLHLAGGDGELGTADDQAFRALDDPALPIDLRPRRPGGGAANQPAAAGSASIRAAVFTVTASARRGDALFQVEAVVQWQGADVSGTPREAAAPPPTRFGSSRKVASPGEDRSTALGYPFKILVWRENAAL